MKMEKLDKENILYNVIKNIVIIYDDHVCINMNKIKKKPKNIANKICGGSFYIFYV